jgi:hypothetical protein
MKFLLWFKGLSRQTHRAIIAILACIFVSWYGGVDYTERGMDQALWLGISVIAGTFAYNIENIS